MQCHSSSSSSSSIPELRGLGGAPQMISQPVSSIFLCSPSGTWWTPGLPCPFSDVFPLLLLSALSSSPFHCALQDGFGQTWWMGDMSIPLQFMSLYDSQVVYVWFDCPLDLGRTSWISSSLVNATQLSQKTLLGSWGGERNRSMICWVIYCIWSRHTVDFLNFKSGVLT